jgi:hypothetical protein
MYFPAITYMFPRVHSDEINVRVSASAQSQSFVPGTTSCRVISLHFVL